MEVETTKKSLYHAPFRPDASLPALGGASKDTDVVIYISYGTPKSASTFVYQLTEAIFRAAGRGPVRLPAALMERNSPENYIDPMSMAKLAAIEDKFGQADVVVKTHGRPDAEIIASLETGKFLASAIIRDPREIALALIDHGKRSRSMGIKDFAEFTQPLQTIELIQKQFKVFRSWAACSKVLLVTYDEVCFDTSVAIEKISSQIGVKVPSDVVLNAFSDPKKIGQFNKGQKGRYIELTDAENERFMHDFEFCFQEGHFSVDRII